MSPPEPQVTSHQHTTWPDDGQLHPNNNPCSEGGPGTDASEGCEEDGGPGGGSAGGGWGGPGERIAVGRDQDPDEAKVKAEDEADDICHGSWALRDFDWDLNLTGRSTYTLTYECV